MLSGHSKIWILAVIVVILFEAGCASDECPIADHPWSVFTYRDTKTCYAAFKSKITWRQARDFCSRSGGYLFQSVNLNLRYSRIYRLMDQECFWIGLSDLDDTGQWIWTDGSPMGKATFALGLVESLLGYFASCASLCEDTNIFFKYRPEIHRTFCTNKLGFLCQYDYRVVATDVTTSAQTDLVASSEPLSSGNLENLISSTSSYLSMTTATPWSEDDKHTNRAAEPLPSGNLENLISSTSSYLSMTTVTPWTEDDKHTNRTAFNDHNPNDDKSSGPKSRKRPQPKRRPSPRSFAVKTSSNKRCTGEPVFRDSSYVSTMCYRKCSKWSGKCRAFNFNINTRECVGFSSVCRDKIESTDHWELWEVVSG